MTSVFTEGDLTEQCHSNKRKKESQLLSVTEWEAHFFTSDYISVFTFSQSPSDFYHYCNNTAVDKLLLMLLNRFQKLHEKF